MFTPRKLTMEIMELEGFGSDDFSLCKGPVICSRVSMLGFGGRCNPPKFANVGHWLSQ